MTWEKRATASIVASYLIMANVSDNIVPDTVGNVSLLQQSLDLLHNLNIVKSKV